MEEVCQKLVYKPWVMDTGAVFHMCSDISMFDTFKPPKSRHDDVVFMNGVECRAMGKGTVKFAMREGSAVSTLSNVTYIPSLNYNLISLGTLESRGYDITMDELTTKVMKGSQLFMAGVKNCHDGLHYLVMGTFMRQKQIYGLLRNNVNENTVHIITSWKRMYEVDERTEHKDKDEKSSKKTEAFSVSSTMVRPVRQKWLMDSGASIHLCPNKLLFDSFTELESGGNNFVGLPNGDKCRLSGKGSVTFELPRGYAKTLTDVFYMPTATLNVISLPTLTSKGYHILMKQGRLRVFKGSQQVMVAKRTRDMLYYLDSRTFMCYQQKESIRSKVVRLFKAAVKRVELKFCGIELENSSC